MVHLLTAVSLMLTVIFTAVPTSAETPQSDAAGTPARTARQTGLSLSKVVLYSNGVGYFQHDGHVQGRAQVDLRFKTHQINDLLKSLVVQDFSGGRVSTVTYGSRDPIAKALASFGINLTANPSLAQLLDQIRGERIEITTPQTVNGMIIGVEKKDQVIGDDHRRPIVHTEYVNLLTDDGLRSIPLNQIQRIKLLNEQLNGEFQHALSVLAATHDAQQKTVSILFNGEGHRDVRVAYVAETPVWKTTYRLVPNDNRPPFLQGWAIVENSSEMDWSDVDLSLVSGRPISFVMDLYQPLYAVRPVVVPEPYVSLRPPVYGDSMEERQVEQAKETEHDEDRIDVLRPRAESRRDAFRAGKARTEASASAAQEPQAPLSLQQGVVPDAYGQATGDLFEYAIQTPVTLARHTSAMLPISAKRSKGKKSPFTIRPCTSSTH